MLLALQGWLQQPTVSWLPYARPGASVFRSRLTPSRTQTVLTPSRTLTIVRHGVGPNDEDDNMHWGLPKKHVVVDVPASRVTTLFSNALEVLPAKPGYVLLPLEFVISRPAGTPYTVGTAVELYYVIGGFTLGNFGNSIGLGVDRAAQYIAYGPGGASQYAAFVPDFSGLVGRPIMFHAIGGDPVGGSYGFTIDLYYVEFPSPGTNMVLNATFSGSASGWTLGAGGGAPDWAFSSGQITHGNGGGTSPLTPTTPLAVVAGHSYRVSFTISGWSAGTLTPTIGGTAGTARGADGTFTQTIVATTTGNLLLTPTTTLVATIDDVSVVDLSAP